MKKLLFGSSTLLALVTILMIACTKENKANQEIDLQNARVENQSRLLAHYSSGNLTMHVSDIDLTTIFREMYRATDITNYTFTSEIAYNDEAEMIFGYLYMQSNDNTGDLVTGMELRFDTDGNIYAEPGSRTNGHIHTCTGKDCSACSFRYTRHGISGCDCSDGGLCNHTVTTAPPGS